MPSLLGLSLLALAGTTFAAPRPQGLDLDVVAALPSPSSYTIAVGVASQSVSVNAASVASSVAAALSIDPDATTLIAARKRQVSTTSSSSSSSTSSTSSTSVCSGGTAQATGSGPVPSPDSASAFVSYSAFASAATSAPVPSGWTQVYQNLDASNNAYYYMGFTTLTSYSSNACAAACTAISGCQAINIYFERDPSVAPGTGTNCLNPPSTTNIKCVFWGAPLDVGTAVNTGQWRDNFQVVIAGSNAYNLNPATPAGYTAPISLGGAAINAPLDCNGDNTYMGLRIFQNTAFNVSMCAVACTASSNYDIAQGIPTASDPQTCQFFNTYMLYKNGAPIAQYCALYNETWNATYATNTGQYDSAGNHYTIEDSYVSSNATNAGVCTVPAAAAPTNFYLAITSADGTYTGQQLALPDPDTDDDDNAYIASTIGISPTVFTLTSAGYLEAAGMDMRAGEQDGSERPYGAIFFEDVADTEFEGFPQLICSIGASDVLSCSVQGNTVFSYCPNDDPFFEDNGLSIGTSVDGGCTAVTVTAVAAVVE